MKTSKLQSKCIKCEYPLSMATNVNEAIPQKGDVSVCANCFVIGEFDESRNIVPMTELQLRTLRENQPNIWKQCQETIDKLRFVKASL